MDEVMDQFFNPIFLLKLAKTYLSDVDRLRKIDYQKLSKYKDKTFRKVVRYAYTVPLYHTKFKEYGIHPDDIHGIKDIDKLPIISKQDLRSHFPDGILPIDTNKKNYFLLSTSGSTGQPVFIYLDRFTAIRGLIGFVRAIKAYGGDWRKTRILLVIDMGPGSIEHTLFSASTLPFLHRFMKLKNIKYIHISDPVETIFENIASFKPQFLGSDPNMLRQLAAVQVSQDKQKIFPEYIFSGGALLDSYTQQYVEKTFHAKIIDLYGTTEGGPLAFECPNGEYHIHSDFVHIEFLDENNQPVPAGTPGHTVITRLSVGGTPIIRYSGIDDMVIPLDKKCSCGYTSDIIGAIEGRKTDLLMLPDGSTVSPLTVTGIPSKIIEKYQTFKIKQFQIIQEQINEIIVLLVLDENLQDQEPSNEVLIKEIQTKFQERLGSSVKITVRMVQQIEKDVRSDYVKVVISRLKQ